MDLGDWRLFALGSAFFAALTAVFGKIGVLNINSNLATFIRTIVILIVLGGILTLRNDWQPMSSINRKSLFFLILSGIATGGSWLCYYHALKLGPASKVVPIDKLSVVFVIVLASLFLGEELSLRIVLGAALIVTGTVVLSL
jgi:bacterial/archaeal transporter family protein